MAFRRRSRLMYGRRGRRSRLVHDWRRRRSLLMNYRLRRRRVHIVFRLPLWGRRESLRRRIMLTIRPNRRRTLIIRAPYRFGRWLMVVTPPIEIASAPARVTSGLTINYLRIAVAINSSPIIVHVRFWLRWRIVSPRHSRHIVIGIDAPATSVSTGTTKGMLIAIAVCNPASNGTTASSHRPTDYRRRWLMVISSRVAIDKSPVRRRNWRMKSRRRVRQPWPAIPSVPAARRPAPAAPAYKHPPAVAIGHPSPWIR